LLNRFDLSYICLRLLLLLFKGLEVKRPVIQALVEILLTEFFPAFNALIAILKFLLVACSESRAQNRDGFDRILWKKLEHIFAENLTIDFFDRPFSQVVDLSIVKSV